MTSFVLFRQAAYALFAQGSSFHFLIRKVAAHLDRNCLQCNTLHSSASGDVMLDLESSVALQQSQASGQTGWLQHAGHLPAASGLVCSSLGQPRYHSPAPD